MASRLMAPGRPHGGDRAPLPPGTITSFPGRREACRAGGSDRVWCWRERCGHALVQSNPGVADVNPLTQQRLPGYAQDIRFPQEHGDHPETAVLRMRWARTAVAGLEGQPGSGLWIAAWQLRSRQERSRTIRDQVSVVRPGARIGGDPALACWSSSRRPVREISETRLSARLPRSRSRPRRPNQ
jgi:hypothetical protein